MKRIIMMLILMSSAGLTGCEKNPKTGEWGMREFDISINTPDEIQEDLQTGAQLPNTGNMSNYRSGRDDLFCPEPQRKRGECK